MADADGSENIVICCDGTGNKFGETNSNVVKRYACLAVDDEQVASYHPVSGPSDRPTAARPSAAG